MISHHKTIWFQDCDRYFPMLHTSWILLCVYGIYPAKFIWGKYCIRSSLKQYVDDKIIWMVATIMKFQPSHKSLKGPKCKWQLHRVLSIDGDCNGAYLDCNVNKKFRLARSLFYGRHFNVSVRIDYNMLLCPSRSSSHIWCPCIWLLVGYYL